jgi:alpha-tubulin suppressor-like RCC1 family protein
VAIAAGASHSLALRADGTVWSWGFGASSTYGQQFASCREPRNKPCSVLPELVPDLHGATGISAAFGASLAIAPQP